MTSKPVRVLTCELTGRAFNYSGRGRPPKYHPEVREQVLKRQRAESRARKSTAKKLAKGAERAALAA